MSMAGVGAMLHALGGGSPKDPKDYYGRKITEAAMKDDAFLLTFEDGIKIKIWDDGQSCCETRYMTCDDNPQDLVGHTLTGIATKSTDDREQEYGDHEIAFLEIQTDKGSIQFATHNEHNGYYGGFGLSLDEV